MRRPRPTSLASSGALRVSLIACALGACAPSFDKLPHERGARGTFGVEVYKLLCRRVAGTEIPNDLDGRESGALCLGDDAQAAAALSAQRASLPAALVALAERRGALIASLDQLAPEGFPGELDDVFQSLIPYYAEPDPRVPTATHALARWFEHSLTEPAAASALARELRDGMVPRGVDNGVTRALGNVVDLSANLGVAIPALLDGDAAPAFEALCTSAALELATLAPEQTEHDTLAEMFARRDDDVPSTFSLGGALITARRDARGLPLPALHDGRLAYPFVDADGDGAADLAGDHFVLDARFAGALPEPFPVPFESGTARDAAGRACLLVPSAPADCTRALYQYTDDRDGTLLAGLLPELGRAFHGDASFVPSMLTLAPALFGARAPRNAQYRGYTLAYDAPLPADQPFLDVVHALGAAQASSRFDDALAVFGTLLGAERAAFAGATRPWLEMLSRTNPAQDAYPDANLADGNTFWDELVGEAEKLARRRLKAGGESALEGLGYAVLGDARDAQGARVSMIPPATLAHAGALLALAVRYRDEWRQNPRTGTQREPDEPELIGAFSVPVARDQPDAALRCGADGCGGPIAGTPYARFALPGQQCLIEHDDQRARGPDCGAPSNQSILQRTLGLMWEGYGRSQCNRALSIADLVDEALGDPCKALEPETTCSTDAECRALDPSSTDYTCDPIHRKCVLRPESTRCARLRDERTTDRGTLAFLAGQAIAIDYVCPSDDPGAGCHAFEAEYPAAFVDPDAEGPETATLRACDLIEMRDVGRVFGKTLTKEFGFEIPNPWVRRFLEDIARAGPVSDTNDDDAIPDCDLTFKMRDPRETPPCIPGAARLTRKLYEEVPADVNTLGELMEFLVGDRALFAEGADTDALRPDVSVLARVLFAAGPAEGVQLFEPLLMRGAPAPCTSATAQLPVCALSGDPLAGPCCIADMTRPPLQYRLDTYFGSTTFALEQPVRFRDGTVLSLLDVTRPIAAAINRVDVDPHAPPPHADVEDTDYALLRVGKLLAEHYDSGAAPSQNVERAGFWYRRHTGLVRYEPLIAALFDDGTIDPAQEGPAGGPLVAAENARADGLGAYAALTALLQALERTPAERAGNMLDALLRSADVFVNPQRFCSGDDGDDRVLSGIGPCDALNPRRRRLTRRDGRSFPCWNDGRCFDGSSPATPRRALSPVTLMRDAVGDVLARAGSDQRTRRALHQTAERALAFFFASDGARSFRAPRAVALLRALVRHLRSGWAKAVADGSIETKAARDLEDVTDALTEPLGAALVGLAAAFGRDDAAREGVSTLLGDLFAEASARPLAASVSDLLELSNAEAVTQHAAGALSDLLVADAQELVAGARTAPDLENSPLRAQLRVTEVLTRVDRTQVLSRLTKNVTDTNRALGASPLDVLSDALLAVHRVSPGSRALFDGADVAQVAQNLAGILRDERRGFERLMSVVRCVTRTPRPEECGE